MMINVIGNEQIIHRFESGVISESSFRHVDHVRLAFAYLSCYPVLQAMEKFENALRQFASTHGKAKLYNETITFAYFFLIRERMARITCADWREFEERNPDLLVWKNGILSHYYKDATLNSDLARRIFLFPDKELY
jgi:hypothetical protein